MTECKYGVTLGSGAFTQRAISKPCLHFASCTITTRARTHTATTTTTCRTIQPNTEFTVTPTSSDFLRFGLLVSGYDHSKQSANLTISLFASNFQHMLKDYTETSRQLFPNYFIPCVRTALTFTSLCLVLKCLELLQFLLLAAAFGSFGPALPPHTSSATTTSLTENTESRKLSLLYCGICFSYFISLDSALSLPWSTLALPHPRD